MSWNYELFNCLRYEYPNEPRGPERPNIPPIPPAGWPLPRVGEVLPVDQNDDRYTPFKARVIGVEWDYAVPRVTVQLEVVRERLAEHDAQVAAKTLRDAASRLDEYSTHATRGPQFEHAVAWLLGRADYFEQGGQP